jgi:glutamate-1-semialdehyde 2,1-aminomutase
VIFSPEPTHEYRDYLTKVDGELSTLAWLYHMNHGIFMTPGVEEEWTLSIAHEQEHIDRYVAAFEGVRLGRHRGLGPHWGSER